MTELKITVCTYEEVNDPEFESPSNFFIVNALQETIFIHTRDRTKAVEWVKEHYDGKYALKVVKDVKGKRKGESGEVSCRGTTSARGMVWMKKR